MSNRVSAAAADASRAAAVRGGGGAGGRRNRQHRGGGGPVVAAAATVELQHHQQQQQQQHSHSPPTQQAQQQQHSPYHQQHGSTITHSTVSSTDGGVVGTAGTTSELELDIIARICTEKLFGHMKMAEGSMTQSAEILEDFLRCMVCFESFRDPKVLRCQHTFCLACLTNWNGKGGGTTKGISCPTCRVRTPLPDDISIESLPSDFKVTKLCELLQQVLVRPEEGESRGCDICAAGGDRKVASHFCAQCSESFCPTCCDRHSANNLFTSHHVVDLSAKASSGKLFCKEHGSKPIKYICMVCNVFICTVCAINVHNGDDHNVQDMEYGLKTHVDNLRLLAEKIHVKLEDVKHYHDQLCEVQVLLKGLHDTLEERIDERVTAHIDKTVECRNKFKEAMAKPTFGIDCRNITWAIEGMLEAANKTLSQCCEAVVVQMKEARVKLTDELKIKHRQTNAEISKRIDSVAFHIGSIESLASFLEQLMESLNPLEIITIYDDLLARVNSILDTEPEGLAPHTFTVFSFDPDAGELDLGLLLEEEVTVHEFIEQMATMEDTEEEEDVEEEILVEEQQEEGGVAEAGVNSSSANNTNTTESSTSAGGAAQPADAGNTSEQLTEPELEARMMRESQEAINALDAMLEEAGGATGGSDLDSPISPDTEHPNLCRSTSADVQGSSTPGTSGTSAAAPDTSPVSTVSSTASTKSAPGVTMRTSSPITRDDPTRRYSLPALAGNNNNSMGNSSKHNKPGMRNSVTINSFTGLTASNHPLTPPQELEAPPSYDESSSSVTSTSVPTLPVATATSSPVLVQQHHGSSSANSTPAKTNSSSRAKSSSSTPSATSVINSPFARSVSAPETNGTHSPRDSPREYFFEAQPLSLLWEKMGTAKSLSKKQSGGKRNRASSSGAGYIPGSVPAPELRYPTNVSFLRNGSVIVADAADRGLQILSTDTMMWSKVKDRKQPFVSVKPVGWGQIEPVCVVPTPVSLMDPALVTSLDAEYVTVTDARDKCIKLIDLHNKGGGACVASWGKSWFNPMFKNPSGVCITRNGKWIVTDIGRHSVSMHDHDGRCILQFGSRGKGAYGLEQPRYVAVDQHDRILVSDSGNGGVKVYDTNGQFLLKIGSKESMLTCPMGVCVDPHGHIIVADKHRHCVNLFNTDGRLVKQVLGPKDNLLYPTSVAVSAFGQLAVSMLEPPAVKFFEIRS